jgi:hypothetical protein
MKARIRIQNLFTGKWLTRTGRWVRTSAAALALAGLAVVVILSFQPHAEAQYPAAGQWNVFTCRVTAQTAITQCQAAPAAGRLYVTDITFSNNVGTAQTLKLQTGTGTNCASSTADLSHAVQFGAAVGNWDHSYQIGLQVPTLSAVCVTPSAATSFSATLTGFTSPQ